MSAAGAVAVSPASVSALASGQAAAYLGADISGKVSLTNVLMTFLLVVHGLLALILVAVILLQKSEGGGFTGGGGGGLVSARGATNLLSRTTAILATLFIVSSLGLAWLGGQNSQPAKIDTSLARKADQPVGPLGAPTAPATDAPAAPADGVPVQN